jgi:hypothetical protein
LPTAEEGMAMIILDFISFDEVFLASRAPAPEPEEDVDLSSQNKTGVSIINKLWEHESSPPFQYPVDETLVPNYRTIVKQPMDLETISKNLKKGVYGDRLAQLLYDVRLIFKNCYLFNMEESSIYQHAKRLELYFEKELLPEAVPAAMMPSTPAPVEAAPIIPVKIPLLSKLSSSKKKESVTTILPQPEGTLNYTDNQACRRILSKLFTHEVGHWFHKPVLVIYFLVTLSSCVVLQVDPIAFGIPTYFDVIKKPMDFGTIYGKLNAGTYRNMDEFTCDMELVLRNALTFNPPDSPVYMDTLVLVEIFEKGWLKPKIKEGRLPSNRLSMFPPPPKPKPTPVVIKMKNIQPSATTPKPFDHRGAILKILKKLKDQRDAIIFLNPVDASLYPDYYTIIKHPMDLATMSLKLDREEYSAVEQFVADVQLMLRNCFTYNKPGTVGYAMGQNVEKAFKKEWDPIRKKLKKM